MKLSVNILTWNTVKTLRETLFIIKEDLKDIEHEIIVVDNGSTDGSSDFATIKNARNMGISVGKNQGIDASKGEYIMLIDGDIVPVRNSINKLLEYLESNKDKDAIGFYPNKFSKDKNGYGTKNHEDFCEKVDPVEEHCSHCVYYGLYRRTVFDRGVRFDERFEVGYGYEDLDIYMQMKKLGIKQYVAGINHKCGKYYHEINSSIRQMGFEKYMETSKERSKIFSEKWGNNAR